MQEGARSIHLNLNIPELEVKAGPAGGHYPRQLAVTPAPTHASSYSKPQVELASLTVSRCLLHFWGMRNMSHESCAP